MTLQDTGVRGRRNEAWLRDLLFDHPGLLPVGEIDPRLGELVPLCTELSCDSGRVDVVLCDARGHLVLVECKLWRNPEARRQVIGQILDYASDFASWAVSDLERAVRQRTRDSRSLAERVRGAVNDPEFDEAAFHDRVALNLKEGRFLLLLVGDGIRESVERISGFIGQSSLRYQLAMVEVHPYETPEGGVVITAWPVLKTKTIDRVLGHPRDEESGSGDGEVVPIEGSRPLPAETKKADAEFWGPLLHGLRLDDPEQEIPSKGSIENRKFYINFNAWVSAYRARNPGRCGVSMVLRNNDEGTLLLELLKRDSKAILGELPRGTVFQDGQRWLFCTEGPPGEPDDRTVWDSQSSFFRATINAYINAFRPRLSKLTDS